MNNKVCRVFLPKLLRFLFCAVVSLNIFCNEFIVSDAADFVPDFVGSTGYLNKSFTSITSLDGFIFVDESDTTVKYYDYIFSSHYSGSWEYSFYNGASVTPFDTSAVNYIINTDYTSPSFGKVKNMKETYSLIIAGQEYPISTGSDNWLIVASSFPHATHITLRCDFEYDYFRTYTFSENSSYLDDEFEITHTIGWDISLDRWDVYNQPDLVSVMADNVELLVNGNAGIQGAIENQTGVIQQQTQQQTDTITNGFDSATGDSAVSNFDSTTADLDAAENNLFAAASLDGFNYDPFTDFIKSESVQNSFSFVKTCMESMFNALGDFGMPLYLGMILILVTRIIGYQNFSSGGSD